MTSKSMATTSSQRHAPSDMARRSPASYAPSLTLHGYAVSNYFNTVHAALIEKGVDFNIESTRASHAESFLTMSAMGKIPFLRTPKGYIAETIAILEYLEDTVSGRRLYPDDAFARAKARQIINIVQMYVEAPLRSLFPGVFMGGANTQPTISAAREMVDRAMRALGRLSSPSPFLTGEDLTYVDLFAFYTFDVGDRVTRFTWDFSLFDQMEGLRGWYETMACRASSRVVLAQFSPAFAAYLQDKSAAWREPEPREDVNA